MPHKDRKARLAYIRAHHEKHRPSPTAVDQGEGLPPLGAMRYSDDGTKVQCHACGRWFGALNTHLKIHEMDADAYKDRYGLARGASLLPPAVQERYREASVARGQGEIGKAYLPPGKPRAKGIEARLSDRIARSRKRKGKYIRGRRPAE